MSVNMPNLQKEPQHCTNVFGTHPSPLYLPAQGGYVIHDCKGTPEVILMGTGSELELAHGAAVVSKKPNLLLWHVA